MFKWNSEYLLITWFYFYIYHQKFGYACLKQATGFHSTESAWSCFLNPCDLCTCNALRDLAPFEEFKKREKDLWRSATFSKVYRNDIELGKVHNMLKSSKDMSSLKHCRWLLVSWSVSFLSTFQNCVWKKIY